VPAFLGVACGSDKQSMEPVVQGLAGTNATSPVIAPATAGRASSAAGATATGGAQGSAPSSGTGTAGTTAGAVATITAGSPAGNGATAGAAGITTAGAGGMAAAGSGGRAAAGSTGSGTCTASKPATANVTGSGKHKVVVELNSDPGIKEGTIFRLAELGTEEKYPIFAWGENGCIQNSLDTAKLLGELASQGYFVIADGLPDGAYMPRSNNGSDTVSQGKPLITYIDWIIAENDKPCSAYYQSIATTKIATSGASCGGLMATGTAGDPRLTTYMLNSSGLFAADDKIYKMVHTPMLAVLGGTGDIAYANGKRDYTSLAALGIPVMMFAGKNLGHGGDLMSAGGGNFGKLDLAWLNWHLKDDLTATGKGFFVGDTCTLCKDSNWEVASMNIQ